MPGWVHDLSWLAASEPPTGKTALIALATTTITVLGGVSIAWITTRGRSRGDEERIDRLEREMNIGQDPVELRVVAGNRPHRRRR